MTKEKQTKKRSAIEKIVVGIGVGKMRNLQNFDDKLLPEVMDGLSLITGQRAATRKAKKSIAGFKTRTGDIIGLQVTLRRGRMEDFLTRLLNIILPRVKDFRGLDEKSVDEHGSLNIGFRDQSVFPEIDLEKSKVSFGTQVTIVPRVKRRDQTIAFYREIGVPFKREVVSK